MLAGRSANKLGAVRGGFCLRLGRFDRQRGATGASEPPKLADPGSNPGAVANTGGTSDQLDVSGFFDNLMTEVCSAWVWRRHPALPARRDGFDTRRPNQSECGVTVARGPSKP